MAGLCLSFENNYENDELIHFWSVTVQLKIKQEQISNYYYYFCIVKVSGL